MSPDRLRPARDLMIPASRLVTTSSGPKTAVVDHCGCPKPLVDVRSETDSQGQLKCARTARSEHLRRPAGGLTKRSARQISAVAREIRFVVQVEYLADQRQTPALLKHERPAQPQIERMKVVSEGIVGRQRQARDREALSILRESIFGIELRDELLQVRAPHTAVYAEYVDTGWSGSKASRPQLNRLMADARKRRFDAICVWKLDRWGRSVADSIKSIQELTSLGVRFVAVTQNI